MELLVAGCLAFVLTHLGISGTPLRGVLYGALGKGAYLGLYSVVAIGTFVLMVYGYALAGRGEYLWAPSLAAYRVAGALLLIAVVLWVMGMLVRNVATGLIDATAVQKTAAGQAIPGLLKITRHPVQWAFILFSLGHLIANGDPASVWLFGSLLTVSLVGTLSMEARYRREADAKMRAFLDGTSMVPFLALLQGRAQLRWGEINWLAFALGLGAFAAFYWLHAYVSGGVSLSL